MIEFKIGEQVYTLAVIDNYVELKLKGDDNTYYHFCVRQCYYMPGGFKSAFTRTNGACPKNIDYIGNEYVDKFIMSDECVRLRGLIIEAECREWIKIYGRNIKDYEKLQLELPEKIKAFRLEIAKLYQKLELNYYK